jgi:putative addiction module component (TIGR02574 family)
MDNTLQNHIANLPAAEQLEIAEFIYQSLASTGDLLTDEQIAETKRRSQQVDDDSESLLTTSEVWAEVDRLGNARKN